MISGTYERLIQQALDLADSGQPEFAVRYYRHAGLMLDDALLPAADDLDRANDVVLERMYKSESRRSFSSLAVVVLLGLLLLAALVCLQIFLSQRMHRTLNPLLLLATAIALWLTLLASASLGREEHHLKVAKEDAFTSIRALWRARAAAYSANGDESRYLLDPLHAADYDESFFAKTRSLVSLPPSVPASYVIAAAERGSATPGFTGYLADELNNITFAGERVAAVQMLEDFERYMAIDAEIRRLERSGQHQAAINLCVGSSEGQSDWAFAQFDQALLRTLQINQTAFDQAMKQGLDEVGEGLEIKAAVAVVLIAILVALGLAGRMREYE